MLLVSLTTMIIIFQLDIIEGTNNKIKTLQRQAYGFRDAEFFKLKIYGFHETQYALVG